MYKVINEFIKACETGNVKKFRQTVKSPSVKEYIRCNQNIVLGLVVEKEQTDILRELINFEYARDGVKINPSGECNEFLLMACKSGHLPTVRELLRSKSVQSKIALNNNEALLEAVKNGHIEVVQLLIQDGAVLRRNSYSDNMALHVAYANEQVEILKVLLLVPSIREAFDVEDDTILNWATLNQLDEIVSEIQKIKIDDAKYKKELLKHINLSLNPQVLSSQFCLHGFRFLKIAGNRVPIECVAEGIKELFSDPRAIQSIFENELSNISWEQYRIPDFGDLRARCMRLASVKIMYDVKYLPGLLKIKSKEWEKAKEYFKNKPPMSPTDVGKMKKDKNSVNQHSFIMLDGEIYAIANKHRFDEVSHALLGQGGFGKVKVIQNIMGDNFAVKIEGRGLRSDLDPTTRINKILKVTLKEGVRALDKKRIFLKREVEKNFIE